MLKRSLPLFLLSALFIGSASQASDFPILDQIAQNLIAKYESATCEQLWAQRAEKAGV